MRQYSACSADQISRVSAVQPEPPRRPAVVADWRVFAGTFKFTCACGWAQHITHSLSSLCHFKKLASVSFRLACSKSGHYGSPKPRSPNPRSHVDASKMLGIKKSSNQSTATPSTERHTQCAPIILVEGNIGVGKTTLIRELSENLGYRVFLEPTAKNPYLAKFYADPKKYALKLQLWIFRQRFLIYVDAVKHVLKTGNERRQHICLLLC